MDNIRGMWKMKCRGGEVMRIREESVDIKDEINFVLGVGEGK